METRSQVMMIVLPDGQPTPLSGGTAGSFPRFSPAGESIALLRPDDKERRQIWLAPSEGGEARQLTHMPGGVTEYAWSSDGKALVFVSDLDPDRLPEDHNPKLDPRVKVVRRIQYRADTIGWRGDAHRHLFTMGVHDEQPRQLTDGDWGRWRGHLVPRRYEDSIHLGPS